MTPCVLTGTAEATHSARMRWPSNLSLAAKNTRKQQHAEDSNDPVLYVDQHCILCFKSLSIFFNFKLYKKGAGGAIQGQSSCLIRTKSCFQLSAPCIPLSKCIA